VSCQAPLQLQQRRSQLLRLLLLPPLAQHGCQLPLLLLLRPRHGLLLLLLLLLLRSRCH
jgi:hypothetical protein